MSGIQSVSVSASQSYASIGTQSQQSLQQFSNLNLTEAQRTQLRSIFTAAKQKVTSQADVQSQVSAVLTPAQQQTLTGDLKAGGGHHHHHHGGSSSSSQSAAAAVGSTSSAQSASDDTTIDTPQ